MSGSKQSLLLDLTQQPTILSREQCFDHVCHLPSLTCGLLLGRGEEGRGEVCPPAHRLSGL